MNLARVKKLIVCVALLCGAQHSGWSAEYFWPVSPRAPARLEETWMESDHVRIKTYLINLAGIKVQALYMARFSVGENDPRWNANFVIAAQPSVKCGFAGFRKGDLLPGVDGPSIRGYLEGLKLKGAEQIDSTVGGSLHDDLVIDGVKPEIVEYVLEGIKRREYFVEMDGRVLVLGYEAPVKYFAAQEENARIIFARLNFLNN